MSTINPLSREVSAKIVYVGPGLSGKTTSLQYIHSRLNPDRRGQLLSLATEEDRTLFFDFLPIRMPRVNGLGVRLQLYTVPGQVFYAATRELVLKGADGVVFVADSQRARREANVEALDSAERQLREESALTSFPMVLQYNKRDLDELLSLDELRNDLNPRGLPEFASTATSGDGVLETLRAIVRLVVTSLATPEAPRAPLTQPLARAARESGIAQSLSAVALQQLDADEAAQGTASEAPPGHEETSHSGQLSVSESPSVAEAQLPALSEDDFVLVEQADQTEVTTERPVAGVSFSALWEPSQRDPIALIESCISSRRYHEAVHHVANSMAQLLGQLPVTEDTAMASRAQLLGVDGHEYLELCQLASQPNEATSYRDALFALYILVAARVKYTRLNH